MIETFEGKQVLITGASGLIGSNLVDSLMAADAKVTVLGRSKVKMEKCFSMYAQNKNFSIVEHDIAKPLQNVAVYDCIFHAAGPMERDIVLNRPVEVVTPNILGTINLLESMRNSGNASQRLILFSSVTVYNNTTSEDLVVSESDTMAATSLDAPTASYAESKRMTEVIAKSYFKQYGIDVVIARFSTVYGVPRVVPNTAFFEFIDKASRSEDIVLNGSNFARRDNIYMSDAVNGLLTVATKGQTGESYNISCGGEKGNYSAVDEIAQVIANCVAKHKNDKPVNVITKETTKRNPGLILDNSKLKSLGWDLKVDIKEGIQRTINELNK